jgi:hypothetical protein
MIMEDPLLPFPLQFHLVTKSDESSTCDIPTLWFRPGLVNGNTDSLPDDHSMKYSTKPPRTRTAKCPQLACHSLPAEWLDALLSGPLIFTLC